MHRFTKINDQNSKTSYNTCIIMQVTRTTTVNDIGGSSFYLRDVIAHALDFLKKKVLDSLSKRTPNVKASDLDWVITVPAIWNAQGKQMMREAGYQVYYINRLRT